MALVSNVEAMPNLKIEVSNNIVEESMDVDEDGNEENKLPSVNVAEDSELEEGEISDSKDDEEASSPADGFRVSHWQDKQDFPLEFERRYENKSGAFFTGIDIFSKEGKEKLDERAKRFGLDPSKVKPLTEEQLLALHESLGMSEEDSSFEKQGFRLDAIHLRGTEDMSTQDVFDYFRDYGPASIEWINDICCNVVWLDKTSPARALLGLSRPISGLNHGNKGASEKLEEVVLVVEENAEDEEADMPEDVPTETPVSMDKENVEKVDANAEVKVQEGAVPASEIKAPIPPGYWRLGAESQKSKCILLRFANRADRKSKQAEKLSEYYKKYGNPNYGGIRGIISSSRKRRFHERQGPDGAMEESFDTDDKNPWGNLAQNWGTMDRKNTIPGFFDPDDPLLLDRPANPRPILHSSRSQPPPPPPTHSSASEAEKSLSESDDEDSKWCKRLRGPHMRMYADEEEVKIAKRKKLTARLGKKPSPPPSVDLRSKLSQGARPKITRGSVWSRLEASKLQREVQLDDPSDGECSTGVEQEEEDEEIVVTSVRSKVNDLRHALAIKKTDEGDDLRKRLDKVKTKSKRVSPTPPQYDKSPLRIEINNDEYAGSGSVSSSSSSSGSSSGSESSSGSSSGSSSSGSSSSSDEEDNNGSGDENSS